MSITTTIDVAAAALRDAARPGVASMGFTRVALETQCVRLDGLDLTVAMAATLSPLARADGTAQPTGSVALVAVDPPSAYLRGIALEMPSDVSYTITTAPLIRAWALLGRRTPIDDSQVSLLRRPIVPLLFPGADAADPASPTAAGPTGAHTTFGLDAVPGANARRWWASMFREPVDLFGARTLAIGVSTALAASAGASSMRLWALLSD